VADGREPGSPLLDVSAAAPGPAPAGPPHWLGSQLRHLAMILLFDLGGPLLVYTLLRSAGMSTVTALILSGIPPALGIAIGALVDKRLDVIGLLVLAGLAVGTVAGLVSHNPRLYLLEGAVPSLVFALACLGSLRTSKPLIYRLTVQILGPRSAKGRQVTAAWQYPGFRRAFQVITLTWGVAYLIEVAVRLVVIEITSTGIALLFSKLVPYAFAICLSGWTAAYGEHEMKKAEQLAAADDPGTPVSADAKRLAAPAIHSCGARHADRHQRLPAPSGRHPVVRARAGHPPGSGHGHRLRAGLGRRGGV
jgi:hypothetical protein